MRRCARCRNDFDDDQFYRRPNGSFGSYCFACIKARNADRRSGQSVHVRSVRSVDVAEIEPRGPVVVGDVVRVVDDYPGTFGLRFLVQKVDAEKGAVHALELEPDGRAVRFRAFPLDKTRVDRRAMRERAEFFEAVGRKS